VGSGPRRRCGSSATPKSLAAEASRELAAPASAEAAELEVEDEEAENISTVDKGTNKQPDLIRYSAGDSDHSGVCYVSGDGAGNVATDQAAFGAIANTPKIVGEIPQMPQTSNAPNAPNVTFENTGFAQSTGWGKLWRLERNGIYFRYKLRFTDSKDTPQECRKVTRQGGKITPKIARTLAKRSGKGRHAASRVEAGRLRSRALNLASRIRSGARRGIESEAIPDAPERGNPRATDLHRDLGRKDMPGLPGLDGTNEMPSVHETDWVM